jgi:ribosomal protein S18 acetylase RimI-like enzyme
MTVTVKRALFSSPELLKSLNILLPQLSSSAPAMTIEDLDALVKSDVVSLFVALNEEEVIGTLTLAIFPIPSGLRGWIEDVIVDERARGAGVGEALSRAAIEEARARGVRSLDLTSRPSRESANALYQRIGFERRDTNVYRFRVET